MTYPVAHGGVSGFAIAHIRPMVCPVWREACKALLDEDEPSLHKIATEVAEKHGLTVRTLRGRQRTKAICKARNEAWARSRKETEKTLSAISRYYGDRDHSTVKYGIKQHEETNG